jgi:small subunit ribosomal protein S17
MTEKVMKAQSDPVEDSSTSAGSVEERGRAGAPDAGRGRADAPDAGRGRADAPDAGRGRADAPDAGRGRRKVRDGYVVSDKMDKTVVVVVEDHVKHRLYGKVLRQTSRLKAHDENNSAAVGDRVRVMESRPISATKRWRLVEILEKAK